jgi:hypothetical protein
MTRINKCVANIVIAVSPWTVLVPVVHGLTAKFRLHALAFGKYLKTLRSVFRQTERDSGKKLLD